MERRVRPDPALRRDSRDQQISGELAHSAEGPIRLGQICKEGRESSVNLLPSVTLPTAGSAFARIVGRCTGSGSIWGTLPMSAERSGFTPKSQLAYDSGSRKAPPPSAGVLAFLWSPAGSTMACPDMPAPKRPTSSPFRYRRLDAGG
jgi:hypothetical protein